MKKWICCIICGTLVLSSFLAAGTIIQDQQKNQTPITASVEEYIPTIFYININVLFGGRLEVSLEPRHGSVNNWTGENQKVKVVARITNINNQTGSTTFFWRIAEWIEPPELIAWIRFWLTHGNVIPTPKQWIAKLTVNWSASEPDYIEKEYNISITINQNAAFEICMWLYHPLWNKDLSGIKYTPMVVT